MEFQKTSRFREKVFAIFANKIVRYLFVTPPAAAGFKYECVGFLIKTHFPEMSKIGTLLSEIWKFRKF